MNEPIVFFGSGPVAAKSLELLAKNFKIEAVITKQKPAHHHGDFPVITLCEELKLKTYYASSKKDLDEVFAASPVKSRLGIVIDYGVIISQTVIDYFPLGIVNSHFSLLPEWRGADPISFAILSGQRNTGVSLMLINEKLDEGEVLAEGVFDLDDKITTPELTDGLIDLSDGLLNHYLPLYVNGEVNPVSQEVAAKAMNRPYLPTYSRKLTKDDGLIDWTKPAATLVREIRAFIEWPKSRTTIAGRDVIITKARCEQNMANKSPISGKLEAITDTGIISAVTGDGTLLYIESLKPSGKKEMTSAEFIRGYGKQL